MSAIRSALPSLLALKADIHRQRSATSGPWLPSALAANRRDASQGSATLRCLASSQLMAPEHVYRCGYFTRLRTSSTTPPPDPAGLLHFISSPVTVIVRVCSAPIQFGNVLFSILSVKVLSATE